MQNILEIAGLQKSFGLVHIIQGLSLDVREGECHAIIGPNGAGKSTLFNLVSGRFAPSSGTIKLRGKDIAGALPNNLCHAGLSRSFQVSNIFPNLTVLENVRCAVMGTHKHKHSPWRPVARIKDVKARVDEVLTETGLMRTRDTPAAFLPYSDQRALEIALTIAGNPSLILLDEPTAGMNNVETEAAIQLIRNIGVGRTVLVIEHDMNVVFGLADRISVLVYGKIIATGTPDEIRANEEVQAAYLGEAVA
jgi:branched-chain amino acid transport system ATP-binding protein